MVGRGREPTLRGVWVRVFTAGVLTHPHPSPPLEGEGMTWVLPSFPHAFSGNPVGRSAHLNRLMGMGLQILRI